MDEAMKSGGDMKRTPRVRLLTREELALWRHVTADVTPRVKKIVWEEAEPSEVAQPNPLQPKPGNSGQNGAQSPQTQVKMPEPPLNPIVPLDRRLKRKLFSGKAHVDDKIDLHGMTQARAHQALNDFLWRAANSGAKLVLVVTGKGNASNFGEHHAEDRGVLRRSFALAALLGAPRDRAFRGRSGEAARRSGRALRQIAAARFRVSKGLTGRTRAGKRRDSPKARVHMPNQRYDVLGLGNAIVDVIAPVDDDFLAKAQLRKGAMQLVDEDQALALYDAMGATMIVSGGTRPPTPLPDWRALAPRAPLSARCGPTRPDTLSPMTSRQPACISPRRRLWMDRRPRAASSW